MISGEIETFQYLSNLDNEQLKEFFAKSRCKSLKIVCYSLKMNKISKERQTDPTYLTTKPQNPKTPKPRD